MLRRDPSTTHRRAAELGLSILRRRRRRRRPGRRAIVPNLTFSPQRKSRPYTAIELSRQIKRNAHERAEHPGARKEGCRQRARIAFAGPAAIVARSIGGRTRTPPQSAVGPPATNLVTCPRQGTGSPPDRARARARRQTRRGRRSLCLRHRVRGNSKSWYG